MLYVIFCNKLLYLIYHEDLFMSVHIDLIFFIVTQYSLLSYNLYNHFSVGHFYLNSFAIE